MITNYKKGNCTKKNTAVKISINRYTRGKKINITAARKNCSGRKEKTFLKYQRVEKIIRQCRKIMQKKHV
jgi:hypothetical protein